MPQAVRLDHLQWRLYYALASVAVLGACAGGLRSIAPIGLAPVPADSVTRWVGAWTPALPQRYDLRWRYATQQGSSAGRAAVRYAPPDTLRFDYRGPFGRSGSAMIVGDEVIWAQPADDAESLVPNAPLFWAALGIPVAPAAGAELTARQWPERQAWRYRTGTEVIDFIAEAGPPRRLLAELRRTERIIGVSDVRFDGAGRPAEATMRFPRDAALFQFTIEAVETVEAFGPETWQR